MTSVGNSQTQLRRMSLLVPYVQTHEGVTVQELAAEFDTSPAQIRKDLKALWFCGLPGQGMGEMIEVSFNGEVVDISFDAGIDRPLQLTQQEATALIVALRALTASPELVDNDSVTSALDKIETAVGDRASTSRAIAVSATPTPAVAADVKKALESRRALEIDYYVATRDEKTTRVVDPVRMVRVPGGDYLQAWCRRAEDMRTFRLDRIDRALVLDEPASPPEDDPRDLSAGVYEPGPDDTVVSLKLSLGGRWLTDYYELENVEYADDGTTYAELPVAEDDALERLLWQLGSAGVAAFIDPHVLEAAHRIGERSGEALNNYR
ncbi:proteasome accessory factor C [Antricoccus suffuscus]|uniref:Proteasome accessory factor C n=1 Tax=Antricoccus suffuscus TaxID=1629062 RepID=A0A2T1A0T6_9ACTN|nr:proteasome accessory factor C [Antricoccus suffuscus]